jgi:hypothetical protein
VAAGRDEITSSIAEMLGLSREEAIITILLYILKGLISGLETWKATRGLPMLSRIEYISQ